MATVIDALVVTLGLNAQNFTQGNREANQSLDRTRQNTKDVTKEEDKREKQQERTRKARNRDHIEQRKQQKESIDNFKEMTKQAVSFFGFATTFGGMASWIGGITQANSQLYRASNNLGTGVESLKEWGMAIEQTGGDAKSAVSTMQMLSKMMTEIKYGILPANMGLFNALGVDLFKAAQSGEPLVEVLKMINKGAQGIKEKNGIRDAINSIQMLGIDYDMANLLAKDEKTLNAFLASADKINKLNQSGAENSAKLSQQWVILKQKGEALGQTIEEKVTPRIFDFIKGLEKLVEENPKAVAAVGILAGAFLVKFSPVRAVLAGIAGLLVADDWVTWANKGESQIGRLIAAAKQFWYTFNGAFTDEAKLKLDLKYADFWKRALNNINSVIFDGDTKSKIGRGRGSTSNEIKPNMKPKELEQDLIKKGYSDLESKKMVNDIVNQAGVDEYGYIKAKTDFAPKNEAKKLDKGANLRTVEQVQKLSEKPIKDTVQKSSSTNTTTNNTNVSYIDDTKKLLQNQQSAAKLASRPNVANTQTTSTSTNSTNVGQVVIYTNATDARGIANELPRALANQAESGGF